MKNWIEKDLSVNVSELLASDQPVLGFVQMKLTNRPCFLCKWLAIVSIRIETGGIDIRLASEFTRNGIFAGAAMALKISFLVLGA